MNALRKTTLALLLTGLTTGAFRLSFDAQLTLATAAGINHNLAWIYPLIIDGFIITAILTAIWTNQPTRLARTYPWAALTLFSLITIAGNALHVQTLPTGAVTINLTLAETINTIPAIALLIATHLATTTILRPTRPSTTTAVEPSRSRKPNTSTERTAPRQDVPPITDVELLAMADDDHLSYAEIGIRIGRSKSYVGNRIKALRDALTTTEGSQEAK